MRPLARSHPNLRRAQLEKRLENAPLGQSCQPPHPRGRRHGCSRIPTLNSKSRDDMTHLTGGGRLKIYLGYAPGVGKTYQMLEDARALKTRGVEVVVGFVDAHDRSDIRQQLNGLESIPLVAVAHRGG